MGGRVYQVTYTHDVYTRVLVYSKVGGCRVQSVVYSNIRTVTVAVAGEKGTHPFLHTCRQSGERRLGVRLSLDLGRRIHQMVNLYA